jgi:hypothetical protein
MVGDKAAQEMWAVNTRKRRIEGTSLENDIIELECLLSKCDVLQSHQAVAMEGDYFWKNVRPKTNVGSARDHDRTTIPHTEHERELISRIIDGVMLQEDCGDVDNADLNSEISTSEALM